MTTPEIILSLLILLVGFPAIYFLMQSEQKAKTDYKKISEEVEQINKKISEKEQAYKDLLWATQKYLVTNRESEKWKIWSIINKINSIEYGNL